LLSSLAGFAGLVTSIIHYETKTDICTDTDYADVLCDAEYLPGRVIVLPASVYFDLHAAQKK
jgi:hypothetical protein